MESLLVKQESKQPQPKPTVVIDLCSSGDDSDDAKSLLVRQEESKQSQLTVNITVDETGHGDTKSSLFVHDDLVKHLKAHQRDGVHFIWNSCFSDCDDSEAGGCILAHHMGLGML
jgi:hypothetical protein